jgi:hypothetical protein
MIRSKCESGIRQIRVHPIQSNTMKKIDFFQQKCYCCFANYVHCYVDVDPIRSPRQLPYQFLFIQKIISRLSSRIHVRQEPGHRLCYNNLATEWAVEESCFDFRQTGSGTRWTFYSKPSRAAFLGDKMVAMWSCPLASICCRGWESVELFSSPSLCLSGMLRDNFPIPFSNNVIYYQMKL